MFAIAIFAFVGGLFIGQQWQEKRLRGEWADKELSLKAIELHKDITTLISLREKKEMSIASDLELWVLERAKGLNLDSVSPASASSVALRETANKLIEYRKRFPSNGIDAAKSPQIAKLASFSGPSLFPTTAPK
jgi:hypothetical protein